MVFFSIYVDTLFFIVETNITNCTYEITQQQIINFYKYFTELKRMVKKMVDVHETEICLGLCRALCNIL